MKINELFEDAVKPPKPLTQRSGNFTQFTKTESVTDLEEKEPITIPGLDGKWVSYDDNKTDVPYNDGSYVPIDDDGNPIQTGTSNYRQYNMDADWVAANPVKARQLAKTMKSGEPNTSPDIEGGTNRARFGSTSRSVQNYQPTSKADTQFVSRVAQGLPIRGNGAMTDYGQSRTGMIAQPMTKAEKERYRDLQQTARNSTDTGFDTAQSNFDKNYDRYPVIGAVHKNSPMGKNLKTIKSWFDDVADERNAIKEAGVGKIVKGVNTTPDVQPGETERQAKKLFPMNKNGKPKSMGVKGATPNQAFNLGLTENMSVTGTERRRAEKKKGLEIGSPEWFKHWFDLPYLREDISKQELLAKLKDEQRSRYIKAMMDAMHQLVQSKGTRHSIGNYAYEIAKTFGYSPKDLEKMYRDTYDVPYDSMVRTEDVTQPQLNALEKAVDNVFGRIGIDVEFTRHFLDRANDERNGKPITIRELGRLFAKEYKRWGKPIAQMGPDTEAVMKDLESDINIPFALRWNGKELELIAKTVMRKKNFSTSNKQFPVENTQGSLAQKINWGGQNKPAKKPTAPKQQDVSWWQRLQQRAFGDADVAENFAEGYKLQLERDKEMLVLNITDTKTGKRTEVRGKSGYETGGYDPKDSLHILLDKVGKSVDISQLMNGEPVGINPKHPKGASAKAATDKAYFN